MRLSAPPPPLMVSAKLVPVMAFAPPPPVRTRPLSAAEALMPAVPVVPVMV